MPIHYKLHQATGSTADRQKEKLFARANTEKPLTTKELIERLSDGKTITPSDALAVLSALGQTIAQEISSGRRVKIEGLGTFTPSLLLDKSVTDGRYLHNTHLSVDRINFRAEKQLLYQCSAGGFVQEKNAETIDTTTDENWAKLSNYLNANQFINQTEYKDLTRQNFYQIKAELTQWLSEGKLIEKKRGNMLTYQLPTRNA